MADKKISELDAAATLDGTELVEIVQDGTNVQSTTQDIADLVDAAAPGHPGYVAGRWYQPLRTSVATGAAILANSMRLFPFLLAKPLTISDLGVRITTLASGGNLQLAIYAADPITHNPTSTALAVTGAISTTLAGTVSADITGADVTLQPGLYWGAILVDGTAGGTVVCQTVAAASTHTSWLYGSTTLANISSATATATLCFSYAHTYGTWPDMTAASLTDVTGNGSALVFFKAA